MNSSSNIMKICLFMLQLKAGIPGQWAAFLLWWFPEPDSFHVVTLLYLWPCCHPHLAHQMGRESTERADLLLKGLGSEMAHVASALLTFSAELHHMATPAAREARKCNAGGPPKTMKLLSIEEFAESAAVPDSYSALLSWNFMVTPERKCWNGYHLWAQLFMKL